MLRDENIDKQILFWRLVSADWENEVREAERNGNCVKLVNTIEMTRLSINTYHALLEYKAKLLLTKG